MRAAHGLDHAAGEPHGGGGAEFALDEEARVRQMERLEQLRALHYGFRIHVQPARERAGFEINTPEDLERAGALGFAPAPTGV